MMGAPQSGNRFDPRIAAAAKRDRSILGYEEWFDLDNSNLDDNDYLNGSTAGFGKKLREINREINNE